MAAYKNPAPRAGGNRAGIERAGQPLDTTPTDDFQCSDGIAAPNSVLWVFDDLVEWFRTKRGS